MKAAVIRINAESESPTHANTPMRIALKVEVPSLKGTDQGFSNLLALFQEHKIRGSFFFSMAESSVGDSTFKRAWSKTMELVAKSSQSENQSETVSNAMLSAIEAGQEIGLCAYDCIEWNNKAAHADADWTRHQLALASEAFEKIAGHAPRMFAAANSQINPHLLKLEEKQGFLFASDTRGKYPFYPVLQNVRSGCPQIPVTLPTIDEMLLEDGVTVENVHEYLYAESRRVLPAGHVFMFRTDPESLEYLPIVEKLLVMWKGQEGMIRPLGELFKELELETLPTHQVGWEEVPGTGRYLATQSIKVEG